MTTPTPTAHPFRPWRSTGAVLAGFVVVFVLSFVVDEVFHVLKVYPPWNEPMRDPALNALALGYRIPIDIFGCYLMARLAPHAPMRHVWIGGVIAFALSSVAAIVAIRMDMGPAWYPIALALSALPAAWLGGTLHRRISNVPPHDA